VLSAVAVVMLAGGCTVSEAGSASSGSNADSTNSSESSSSGTDQPSVDVPVPPKDLSLDGIDPCTLLSESQRAELSIDEVRPDDGSGAGSVYEGMKACSLDKDAEEPFISYDLVAVTNLDVSWWINERHNADVKLISIDGYPAAQFNIKGSNKYGCGVALGVAKNQFLHVEMLPLSNSATGDQICQGSKQAAAMALQTLQTMR
jgi:uncharacterized protein DUF3558